MKEQWLRIQQHREFDEAMRQEHQGDDASQTNWRKKFTYLDAEVGAAREFMRARIREIRGGTYHVYHFPMGGASYNKTQADKHMQPFTSSSRISGSGKSSMSEPGMAKASQMWPNGAAQAETNFLHESSCSLRYSVVSALHIGTDRVKGCRCLSA